MCSSLLSRNRDHSGIRKRLAAIVKEWRNISVSKKCILAQGGPRGHELYFVDIELIIMP